MDQGQMHAEKRSNHVRSPLIGGREGYFADGAPRPHRARTASAPRRAAPAKRPREQRTAGRQREQREAGRARE
jgi:hypothetical protein